MFGVILYAKIYRKKRRIAELNRLLKNCYGTAGARHEVQFMRDCLLDDKTNDTSILIPASILLYQPSNPGKTFCEYDGLVIHPYRKEGQVLFLEAKDTKKAEQFAKRCLKEKFIKTDISLLIKRVISLKKVKWIMKAESRLMRMMNQHLI